MQGGNFIVFFLAPATVVLAIPLFRQIDLLKKNFVPIMGGGIVAVSYTHLVLYKAYERKISFCNFVPRDRS